MAGISKATADTILCAILTHANKPTDSSSDVVKEINGKPNNNEKSNKRSKNTC